MTKVRAAYESLVGLRNLHIECTKKESSTDLTVCIKAQIYGATKPSELLVCSWIQITTQSFGIFPALDHLETKQIEVNSFR